MENNILKDKSKLLFLNVDSCFLCFNLHSGTWSIGLSFVLTGIIWAFSALALSASGASVFQLLISTVLLISTGSLIIAALMRGRDDYLWYSIYLVFFMSVWMVISSIILFASGPQFAGHGAIQIIYAILCVYFGAVLRSYAFTKVEGIAIQNEVGGIQQFTVPQQQFTVPRQFTVPQQYTVSQQYAVPQHNAVPQQHTILHTQPQQVILTLNPPISTSASGNKFNKIFKY